MQKPGFDSEIDRTGTSSQKWDTSKGRDILPMWVADSDFMSPEPVKKALIERIEHGIFGYTNTPDELNRLFIDRMARLYNWQVSEEELIWLPGLVTGLHLACRATKPNSDETISVATPTPIYPPFKSAPALSGCTVVTVPMREDAGRYVIDFSALEQVAEEIDLLLFCNPHNPGGTIYREDELKMLGELAIQYDFIICSDEIHCDLLLEPAAKHIPLASISPEIAARTITLMAPSKTWNIAGLGCSVAVIQNSDIRQRFQQRRKGIVPDVNLLGYTAAIAAYRDGDEWNQQQCHYLKENRDLALERINSMPGLSLNSFEATYLAWIDCSKANLEDPHAFFEQAGVGLSPGRDFGDPHFVRMNLGCTRATLTAALDRIERALNNAQTQRGSPL